MPLPNHTTRRCQCPACGYAHTCVLKDDGSWALCPACQVMMKPVHVLQDRRNAKARAELAEQERVCAPLSHTHVSARTA